MKRTRFVLILLIPLALVACGDDDLQTIAKALRDTSQAVGVLQTVVIDANRNKILSDDITRQLLEASVLINKAGLDAVAITRDLNQLTPGQRQNLMSILKPVMTRVTESKSVISGIGNEQTRGAITTALLLIETSLSTVQLTLAATQ